MIGLEKLHKTFENIKADIEIDKIYPRGLGVSAWTDILTDIELLARLLYGEARGEGVFGMYAVGHVVMNRVARGGWWGNTLREVILHPYQFSCFNADYVERIMTPDEPVWLDCIEVASYFFKPSGNKDNTNGATHYFADSIEPPAWALDMIACCTIGHHLFCKDKL